MTVTPISFQNFVEFSALSGPYHEDELNKRDRQLLGAIGLVEEAGEVAGIFKKHIFHGKAFDLDDLIKESGDVLWYLSLILSTYGITFEQVMARNVTKLGERHGHDVTRWIDVEKDAILDDIKTIYK